MIDTENLIISAPNITPCEVKNILGNEYNTVADVCLSPDINEWSRYKPIYLRSGDGINFHFRGNGYEPSLHGLIAKSYYSWNNLADKLIQNGKIQSVNDWSYNQSDIRLSSSPKRLGDFDGYYHNAAPPFAGFFCPPTLGNKTAGSQQKAYLLPAIKTDIGADDPVAPGSIGLSQINAPSMANIATTTLNNFYFGVALIKPQNATVAWVLSENAMQDITSGDIQHTYEVPMSLTSVAAGTYYAVPVLTRARVSSLQSTPQQICIVPNCSPIQVTVTDSSVVNEDLIVVFTTCQYIPSSTNSGEGIVRCVIRVENKGNYAKRVNYRVYVTTDGDSTQKHLEIGDFNIDANSMYSFSYSPSMTIDEARAISVNVNVRSYREDGMTPQNITVTRKPIVPAPEISDD